MQNIENTPRREDDDTSPQQAGVGGKNQQGQGDTKQSQQGSNTDTGKQANQSSTYRGQEGQEYDVDSQDAVNRQADYSGNSERDIEESSLDTDKDIVSPHDSDQDITPGDRAPNKDFNR